MNTVEIKELSDWFNKLPYDSIGKEHFEELKTIVNRLDAKWISVDESIGYICPACESPQQGLPEIRTDDHMIYFVCKVCGVDWSNSRDILRLVIIQPPTERNKEGNEVKEK